MVEEKYKVVEVTSNSEWDNFLLKTENKNIYSSSEFINNSKVSSKKYFIKKKDEIFASFHLFLKENTIIIGDRIYSPLNFKLFEKQNLFNFKDKKFEIIDIYANFIKNNVKSGEICLDFIQRLRPFYWINFNEKKEIFNTKSVKYTSTLNIKDTLNINKYSDISSDIIYKNFSRSLKQQIIKSSSEDFQFKKDWFKFLSTLTKLIKIKLKLLILILWLKKFTASFSKNKLIMFVSVKNNEKLSYCIFGLIGDSAIYLNGGRVENDTMILL